MAVMSAILKLENLQTEKQISRDEKGTSESLLFYSSAKHGVGQRKRRIGVMCRGVIWNVKQTK